MSNTLSNPEGLSNGGGGVVIPGCPACRKRLFTMQNFMNHLADDVLPDVVNRLSSEKEVAGGPEGTIHGQRA
jgi:hypothetical protein